MERDDVTEQKRRPQNYTTARAAGRSGEAREKASEHANFSNYDPGSTIYWLDDILWTIILRRCQMIPQ